MKWLEHSIAQAGNAVSKVRILIGYVGLIHTGWLSG